MEAWASQAREAARLSLSRAVPNPIVPPAAFGSALRDLAGAISGALNVGLDVYFIVEAAKDAGAAFASAREREWAAVSAAQAVVVGSAGAAQGVCAARSSFDSRSGRRRGGELELEGGGQGVRVSAERGS